VLREHASAKQTGFARLGRRQDAVRGAHRDAVRELERIQAQAVSIDNRFAFGIPS
jgi:hypothetical protein